MKCACGCGGKVIPKRIRKDRSFPKYINHHNLNNPETHPSWKGGEELSKGKKRAKQWFKRITNLPTRFCPEEIIEMRINIRKAITLIEKEKQND
jgi:hypothetical protein